MNPKTPHICIALMDDPYYKQSAIRVAGALARAGYKVTLVGRRLPGASGGGTTTAQAGVGKAGASGGGPAAASQPFRQVRFYCLFKKGVTSYAEMNIRLFFYLLFHKVDLVCAVNLDTILPCWMISVIKRVPRVYDARELFTEMAELVARPRIQKVWLRIERGMVPRFPNGYAVCQSIADEFHRRYGVQYAVVRNMTVLEDHPRSPRPLEGPYLLYQGAVNHGRGLGALIPAMRSIGLPLVICGSGNYMRECRELVKHYGLESRIVFTGQLMPTALRQYTDHAYAGINLVEREGLNQYYSLPNKLFDYLHAGVPQVTMDYPEYQRVQAAFEVAVLIPELTEEEIVRATQHLIEDPLLYSRLRNNCEPARRLFNWQAEEPVLVEVFRRLMPVNIR